MHLQVRKYSIFFWCCLFFSILLPAGGFFSLKYWGSQPQHHQKEVKYHLKPGRSLRQLSQDLADQGALQSSWLFELCARFFGNPRKIQAGTYLLPAQSSPLALLELFTKGEVHHELALQLEFPEGFTLAQIVSRVAARLNLSEDFVQREAEDPSFFLALEHKATSLEGYLYPATYPFYGTLPSVRQIFKAMREEFNRRLPDNYTELCHSHKLTLHEAVTFASLIEKETQRANEIHKVSEVIWNRLHKKMPLGIDASIIYGIENFDGNLRFRHLKDVKNLYNTRIHRGLPPGPIGSPSLAALKAVFSPTKENIYYYVLLPNSGGKHHFSKSLSEHNYYVRKLVRFQKAKKKEK